jgi:hypothetical protein
MRRRKKRNLIEPKSTDSSIRSTSFLHLPPFRIDTTTQLHKPLILINAEDRQRDRREFGPSNMFYALFAFYLNTSGLLITNVYDAFNFIRVQSKLKQSVTI